MYKVFLGFSGLFIRELYKIMEGLMIKIGISLIF